MKTSELKEWLILVGAAAVAVLLAWFGFKLLFNDALVSTNQLFWLGVGSVLGGVFAFSSEIFGRAWWGISLLLVGVYFFARSSGTIHGSWLLRLLGLASLLAAGMVLYVAWARQRVN